MLGLMVAFVYLLIQFDLPRRQLDRILDILFFVNPDLRVIV